MLTSLHLEMCNYMVAIIRREELAQCSFEFDRSVRRGLRRVYSARMGLALAEMQRQGKVSLAEFEELFETSSQLAMLKVPKADLHDLMQTCKSVLKAFLVTVETRRRWKRMTPQRPMVVVQTTKSPIAESRHRIALQEITLVENNIVKMEPDSSWSHEENEMGMYQSGCQEQGVKHKIVKGPRERLFPRQRREKMMLF